VINDGLGHHTGDRLLSEVAARIRGCVRPEDTLGRLAGDEFVVITQDCASGAAEHTTSRILEAVGQPYEVVGSVHVRTSMSIGVACSSPGMTPMEVLRHADAALHRAKSRGRGRVSRFDQELRAEVSERVLIEADFLPALEAGDVHWHFQPEIELLSGRVSCLEALCRWDHPDLGPISPDRFVPVVETAGQAGELFTRALDSALEVQEALRVRHGALVPVAVNLSSSLLDDDRIVGLVSDSLDRLGAAARGLCVEVTEEAMVAADAERVLAGLHSLGVVLAVDDFGKGWSSMARLASFPWDVLKIDRSLVSSLGEGSMSDRHRQMVAGIVAMAGSLGARVVAEGVETASQLAAVRELGCDVVQGWVFSPAVDPRELSGLVHPAGSWVGPGHELLGHRGDARLDRRS
jgi:diguanylate cyclase (GGDEF)-like protein